MFGFIFLNVPTHYTAWVSVPRNKPYEFAQEQFEIIFLPSIVLLISSILQHVFLVFIIFNCFLCKIERISSLVLELNSPNNTNFATHQIRFSIHSTCFNLKKKRPVSSGLQRIQHFSVPPGKCSSRFQSIFSSSSSSGHRRKGFPADLVSAANLALKVVRSKFNLNTCASAESIFHSESRTR